MCRGTQHVRLDRQRGIFVRPRLHVFRQWHGLDRVRQQRGGNLFQNRGRVSFPHEKGRRQGQGGAVGRMSLVACFQGQQSVDASAGFQIGQKDGQHGAVARAKRVPGAQHGLVGELGLECRITDQQDLCGLQVETRRGALGELVECQEVK